MRQARSWKDLILNEYQVLVCGNDIAMYRVHDKHDDVIYCDKKILLTVTGYDGEHVSYKSHSICRSTMTEYLTEFFIPENEEEATMLMLRHV